MTGNPGTVENVIAVMVAGDEHKYTLEFGVVEAIRLRDWINAHLKEEGGKQIIVFAPY